VEQEGRNSAYGLEERPQQSAGYNYLHGALLEKPPVVQTLKNFPEFYGIRRFITVFTGALHSSLF
jgi:hypothetical protein